MQTRPDYSSVAFFIDRNIDSPDICSILSKAGLVVHRHKDHFDQEEDDDIWISAVATRDWAILSADKNIEKRHLATLIQSKAKMILLIGKRSGAIQWASSVVVAIDKIFAILRANDGPLVIRLGRSGELKVRLDEEVRSRHRKLETNTIARQKKHGVH